MLVSTVKESTAPRTIEAKAQDQALVLFTSRSTGEPKGLKMTHANLASVCEVSSRIFAASTENLLVLQQSPFSFEFSFDQTSVALANASTLYIVPAWHRGDPLEISKVMVEEKVTYITATPSEYDIWLRYGASDLRRCDTWTRAYSGGEAMSYGLAREFATLKLKNLHLFNEYGPAETTILSTKIDLPYAEPGLPDPSPAGYMMPGFSVCIVDPDLNVVLLGVPGEIIIGGPCIIAGYLGRDDLAEQKFFKDTFFGTSSQVYRSGDRGRLMEDEILFCDGRLKGDTQVKVREFRVELSEIEKVLVKHASGVLAHAVVTSPGDGSDRHLIAHVVFSSEFPKEQQDSVVQSLRQTAPLPPYMKPFIITPLDDIPRTFHSKIDRKAIQTMALPVITQENEDARQSKPTPNAT